MRDLGQVELLSPQEEIRLAAKVKKGNAEARERMVLLQKPDRQTHDAGKERCRLQRVAIAERQRRARRGAQRDDRCQADELRGHDARSQRRGRELPTRVHGSGFNVQGSEF